MYIEEQIEELRAEITRLKKQIEANSETIEGLTRLPSLLSAKEAAHQLGVSTYTLYEYVKDGKIKAVKEGRTVRVPREAINNYVKGV